MSGGGEVDVDLDPRIRPLIEPPAEATEGIITAALETGVAEVLKQVKAGWPVDTGTSLAGWSQNGTRLVNATDYTAYVHNGLYEVLINAAINDAAAKARASIHRSLEVKGAGKEDFREKQRKRLAALEARRAAGPMPAVVRAVEPLAPVAPVVL